MAQNNVACAECGSGGGPAAAQAPAAWSEVNGHFYLTSIQASLASFGAGRSNSTVKSAASFLTIASGTVTLSFNVFLSLTTDRTVTLDRATADGTATAGVGYVAGGASVTFNAGPASAPRS